eukprot:47492_1
MSAVQNALRIRNQFFQNDVNNILTPLNEQKSNLSLSIKGLSTLANSIQKNTIECQQHIEQHFNSIIDQIQLKKQQLFEQMSLIETRKLAKIATQRELLTKSKQSVVTSLTACNDIQNSSLKAYQKKQKLKQLTKDALNTLQIPPKLHVSPKISYTLDQSNVSSFIGSLCSISDDFLSPLPTIMDTKCDVISHETVTIHWNALHVSSNNLHVTLAVTPVCDATDDKKMNDMDTTRHIVPLETDKTEYSYTLEGLIPNQSYDVSIRCLETDVSTNEATERSDFVQVLIKFKTKKAPPKVKLFRFQSGHESMKVSDNGLSVTGNGQLRFGEYLKADNKQIYQVTFSMKDVDPEDCGIGFATKGFINTHNNHRMIVYGNKKILMAKEFKKGEALSGLFWEKGDDVVIEINMKRKQGIMHRKRKDDIGIDRWDDFYKVDLPDLVAICVRFASNTTQTLTVTHQRFV